MKIKTKDRKRFRVRNKLKRNSTPERYRLTVSRSLKNISAQIVDDIKHVTLISSSSKEKKVRTMKKVNKTELSKIVAENLAKKAQEKNITKIYFDRGIYKYHGRVKALAEAARKGGLGF